MEKLTIKEKELFEKIFNQGFFDDAGLEEVPFIGYWSDYTESEKGVMGNLVKKNWVQVEDEYIEPGPLGFGEVVREKPTSKTRVNTCVWATITKQDLIDKYVENDEKDGWSDYWSVKEEYYK